MQDYGIRLTKEYLSSISFSEFSNLLNGLTKNTVLGQQMLLRATKNNKAFNNMSGKNKTELTVDWKDKKQKNMFFDLIRPRKR